MEDFSVEQTYKRKHPRNNFTLEEDNLLKILVEKNGTNNWKIISEHMKTKNERQCKERWNKYLSPSINNDKWSPEEDEKLLKMYSIIGCKWVAMCTYLKGRTDNQIKNRFKVIKRKIVNPNIHTKVECSHNNREKQGTSTKMDSIDFTFDDVISDEFMIFDEFFFNFE